MPFLQPFLVKGADFADQGGKAEVRIPVVGEEGADPFHFDGVGHAGVEQKPSRQKKTVCAPDHETLDGGAAVMGDAEGAFIEGTQQARPTSRPFRKDEDIAPGSKIFLDVFAIPDHERRILSPVRRRDVAGLTQQITEDRRLEKSFFNNRLLLFKERNEEEGIQVGQVVRDDDGGMYLADVPMDLQGKSRGDAPQNTKDVAKEALIQTLKGDLAILSPEPDPSITRGKQEEKAQYEIDPYKEGDGHIAEDFKFSGKERHGGSYKPFDQKTGVDAAEGEILDGRYGHRP